MTVGGHIPLSWDHARARLSLGKSTTAPREEQLHIRWTDLGEEGTINYTGEATTKSLYDIVPPRSEYFSWINNTNEGADEQQTLVNLDYFRWLHDRYGMQLDIYAFDAGAIDGSRWYGTMDSPRFTSRFPYSFDRIAEKAAAMNTRLGLWGGPDGFGNDDSSAEARKAMMDMALEWADREKLLNHVRNLEQKVGKLKQGLAYREKVVEGLRRANHNLREKIRKLRG